MRLIEILKQDNGSHRNQTISGVMSIPEGWAEIPENMETENFPFGDITVEEINGKPTVTSWTPIYPVDENNVEEQGETA